ncbi:hypothetical protein LTS10_002574 [Elasticomyces elasticus]|nr:hypothetical protein LTS10_002574 [Elasticomyces elasticus]
MMAINKCLALVSLLFSYTTASPIVARQLFPLSPSIDPFYQPPAGFETKAPGTILKQRSAVTSIFGLLVNPVKAYQLLYRTTAVNGSAITTATTIFKPLGAKKDRFVSFHTAYDSAAVQCNPSYTYQLGAIQTDLITSVETIVLEGYLKSGYIVTSPDYEGPEAAFGAGHLEGMAVLDGMRAVKNFRTTLGLTGTNPMTVGYGYSGGAIATGWAAALQPAYAPELNIKGWAGGGLPSNLSAVVDFVDNTLFSGFLPGALAGLAKDSAYGAQLNPVLDRYLTPYGRSIVTFAENNCAVRDIFAFSEQSILSTKFQTLGDQLLYEPTVAEVLADNVLGVNATEAPRAPVLLYHASQDEIIPYANAKETAADWCSQGSSVSFTTYAAGGHAGTEVSGFPEALTFVGNAFAGTVPAGCSSNTVLNDTLDPLALGLNLEPITTRLIDALAKIGENDSNIKADLNTLTKTVGT